MKAYTVYRVNYKTNTTEAVGTVVERRTSERNNNAADMLRLAQRLYGTSALESHLFIVAAGALLSF